MNNLDIVYVYKFSPKTDELKYSLRSLKNLPHNKVFIVGGIPDYIDKSKVVYIRTVQNSPSKHKNTTINLESACLNQELSDDFILMNDDFFIKSPITDIEYEFNINYGFMKDHYKSYLSKNVRSVYSNSLNESNLVLTGLGFKNPLSYELHSPMILNKKKFLDLLSKDFAKNRCFDVDKRSFYGNYYKLGGRKVPDCKIFSTSQIPNESMKFFSTSDLAYERGRVKNYIKRSFNEKSIYEK